jgi:hypothetical protein
MFLCLLLAGCGIGGFWMTGISGQAREDYLKSIKAYGEYWVKEGMTVEQRRRDSWDCGAGSSEFEADRVDFTPAQIKAERRPEEKDDFAARGRLRQRWVECMRSKGYEYRREVP